MKLMKENKTLVICGAIILVALVFAFVPGVPYMASALQGDVQGALTERFAKIATIHQLTTPPLSLPNTPEGKGVPLESWIVAKKGLIQEMGIQQVKVDEEAKRLNM